MKLTLILLFIIYPFRYLLAGLLIIWMFFCDRKTVSSLGESFTVTAHTGCSRTADNSLDSIRAAINDGAQVAEFDLRFDGEGNGILAHDEGKINPVTLEEAFRAVASDSKLKVNVDVKATDNLKEVYRLSKKYGISDRIFYTGIEEKDVQAVKEQTPEVSYYLNYAPDRKRKNDAEYISSLILLVKEKGAIGLNVRYTLCSKKMSAMFKNAGLKVSLWTANDVLSMLLCLRMTPDNITTKKPEVLNIIIKLLSKH